MDLRWTYTEAQCTRSETARMRRDRTGDKGNCGEEAKSTLSLSEYTVHLVALFVADINQENTAPSLAHPAKRTMKTGEALRRF